MFETEKKLVEQIEKVKLQKDQIHQDLSKKMEKEKETFKSKLQDIEEKNREGEKKDPP